MRKHYFTLMEVLIASAILAMAAVATMSIIGGARSSLLRAEKRWGRQHLLAQTAELYLIGGPETALPDGLLPNGYSSSCTLEEVEDIHEEAQEHIKEWCLGEFHIQIFDVSGKLMAETRVRKLIKEEDLE
ncbi:MAG: prepilin-type N-terminal cleavage/methylation domain-containing protein [Lentisphaeria bacterium]